MSLNANLATISSRERGPANLDTAALLPSPPFATTRWSVVLSSGRANGDEREAHRALDLLEKAAKLPVVTNYGELKLDETWDPVRDQPRFAAILAAFAPPPDPPARD